MPEKIHFIWAGPSPDASKYVGQDTMGPDLLRAKYPKQPMFFWCLKKEVVHYKRHFYKKNITVIAIEDFVKLYDDDFYLLISALKRSALSQKLRPNASREYTTIKAATQYFLQIFFEGYFLDTNVIPRPNYNKAIPKLTRFSFPYLLKEKTIDPWLMYSPKNDRKAVRRFNEYFLHAQMEFSSRTSIEKIDRKLLGNAFVDAAKYSCGTHLPTYSPIGSEITEASFHVLNFQKRYMNTHKNPKDLIHKIPLLHLLLCGTPSFDEFKYLLSVSNQDPSEIYSFDDGINVTKSS